MRSASPLPVGAEREFVARTGRDGKFRIVVEFQESLRGPHEGLRFGDAGRDLGGVDAARHDVEVGRAGEIGLAGPFCFGVAVVDGDFIGTFDEDVLFGVERRDALPRAVEIGARDPQGELAPGRSRDLGTGSFRRGFRLGVDRNVSFAGDADRALTPPRVCFGCFVTSRDSYGRRCKDADKMSFHGGYSLVAGTMDTLILSR